MTSQRLAGLLLHPTSLPGNEGIGVLGADALRWVEQLPAMGVRAWQTLPLGPTGYGDSPYQCHSSFAGNPLLVSLQSLVEEGLLEPADLVPFASLPKDRVDFGALVPLKQAALRKAAGSFLSFAPAELRHDFADFCEDNAWWLDDYALYDACKRTHGLRPWNEWDPALRRREEHALEAAREAHDAAIEECRVVQFFFDRQWSAVRARCAELGITVIGDLPIFVAYDSADVWSAQELFDLDPEGAPRVIAGVPPDYFSPTGQRWGNPLYRWENHSASGWAWWIARLRRSLQLADSLRIDHFRGFAAYWEVPASEPTAINGRWAPAPGRELFNALRAALGENLPIIAEDLGVITPDVEALRDDFGLPGMRILQFAFGNDPKADDYKPAAHPENSVAYTGTHDNDTTVGWWSSQVGAGSTRSAEEIAQERAAVLALTGSDGSEIHWDMIRLALGSRARLAVVPLQDVLGLGSEARMNAPGTASGNWTWRFRAGALTPVSISRLHSLCVSTGRS